MTTLQMQNTSNFEPSAAEDPMELTSDMDRRFAADEDIDIDLDLTADHHQDLEDEYMGEDVNVFKDPAPANEQEMYTANDDEMADDTYAEGSVAGRSSVQDEDLEDAASTAPYFDEDTIAESYTEHTLDGHQAFSSNSEAKANQKDDLGYHEMPSTSEADSGVVLGTIPEAQTEQTAFNDATSLQTNKEVLQDSAQDREELSRVDDIIRHEDTHESIQGPSQSHEKKTNDGVISSYEYSTEVFAGEESYASETNSDQPVLEEESEIPSKEDVLARQNVTEEEQVEKISTALGEPTLQGHTYVHPVVIVYQDTEISLFPPIDQDEQHSTTYLLQDEQVAGESIKKLLGACRSILGDSITDHDELSISIDDLGLDVSEFTTDLSNITLLQLIDVHIDLHHNDGLENPPPLYMNLTTKTTFSHRFESLQNAVMEGKGFSQLRTSEVYYDEQHAEADGGLDHVGTDELQHTDVEKNLGADASVDNEGTGVRDTHQSDDSQSNAVPLADSQQTSDTATQASIPKSSIDDVGKDSDTAEAQLDSKEAEEVHRGRIPSNESVHTNEEAFSPSSPPLTSQARAQRPAESTLEDEDSIEYEEEETAPGTSTGSSTLQGDLDTNADIIYSETKDRKPSAHDGDLNNRLTVHGSTVETEEVNDDLAATAETEGQGPYDVEDGFGNPNRHEEEDEDELGEEDNDLADDYDEGWNEEAVGVHDEGQLQQDQLGSVDNANDNQDEKRTQQEDPEENDEIQEQAAQNHAEEYLGDGALSEIGSGDRLLSHSIQNEDEILRDPQAEEQTNVDDIGSSGGLPEEDSHMLRPSDDHVSPFKETNLGSLRSESNAEPPRLDDDEISYEDEDGGETIQEASNPELNTASSPGYLKRPRSLHEDDDGVEEKISDAKRVRSD
ncbi:hypothetical protein N7G274_008626 [Stereocaulon virgatum]|uniref:Uncharacterized protein n=1 Tax=Stereocaulon virgatum TaxID=373712 RepID=A0ABR3ZYX0_9LECA